MKKFQAIAQKKGVQFTDNLFYFPEFKFIRIVTQEFEGKDYITIYISSSSWDFEGDRSDIHGFTSFILLIFLKTRIKQKLSLYNTDNIVGDLANEDRFIILEDIDTEIFDLVLESVSNTLGIQYGNHRYSQLSCSLLTKKLTTPGVLARVKKYFASKDILASHRINFAFESIRILNEKIELYGMNAFMFNSLKKIMLGYELQLIEGITGRIVIENGVLRIIPRDVLKKIEDLFLLIEESRSKLQWYSIRTHFMIFSERYMLILYDDFSYTGIVDEKEHLKKYNKMIYPNIEFTWSKKINGGRFQKLIRKVLIDMKNVTDVREVGSSNEGDGGRDLEISYIDLDFQQVYGVYKKIKIIIQCKAYQSSVGKGNVRDIRDTLDNYQAQGYWLIVSSSITTFLYNYLDTLKERDGYWIKCWTRDELEDYFRGNVRLLDEFQDIITYKIYE